MFEKLSVPLLMVVEELPGGTVRVSPLGARGWLTHGTRDEAESELRTFLQEELAEASPAVIARLAAYASPELHALRMVGVSIRLADHEELAAPIDFACVILGKASGGLGRALSRASEQRLKRASAEPTGRGVAENLWVAVPILDHVMRIPEGLDLDDPEALDSAIAADVARVVSATATAPVDLMAVMPPQVTTLVPITVDVARPERLGGQARSDTKETDRQRRLEKQLLLERMGRRLGPRPAPELRSAALDDLGRLVRAEERLAVLVRGPELAGKSAVIEHVLGSLERPAFAISVARFLAGDGGLGDWQQRVEECFRAAELLDAVIYLDDLGSIALERPGSPIDLGAAMAPFLESRRVRFVGELRDEELDRFESRHRRLSGTLLRVRVDGMTVEETQKVLARTLGQADGARRPLAAAAIEAFVPMIARYLPARALPGEALVTGAALVQALPSVRDAEGHFPEIERGELLTALAERIGLPAALVRDEVPLPPDAIALALGARVIGQDEAVELVARTLAVVKAGLPPAGKPIATFLFVGPTGTGKTELARSLAAYLFGDEGALARFDMSEFMDPWAADRLIRGSDREDGLLTRRVRERPFSVLLLDEIEKAHPAVFDLLLALLGEGRLSDARGRTASFVSTIVVMTSNLGARGDRPPVGLGRQDGGLAEAEAQRRERYLRAVREHFRPELLNRIDRIVPFRSLSDEEALAVARLFVRAIERRPGLLDRRHGLAIDDDALTDVVADVMRSGGGARALRRTLEDTIVVGAARLSARGLEEGEPIAVRRATVGHGLLHAGLSFDVPRRRGKRVIERGPFDRLTALRRRIGRLALLGVVEAARSEVARLVAELARSRTDESRGRQLQEQRLGHLRQHLTAIEQGIAAIELLEENALTELVEDGAVGPLLQRAEAVGTATELAVWKLMSEWDADEDVCGRTVLALGGSDRALGLFLLPWLENEKALGLFHLVHFPRGIFPEPPRAPTAKPWPAGRVFGPDYDTQEALTALRSSVRLGQPRWGGHPACAYFDSEGASIHALLAPLTGLVRFVVDGKRHDVLVAEPPRHPNAEDARLPEVVAVPPRPTLTVDLDLGVARLDGHDAPIALDPPGVADDAPRPHGRWVLALPRIAVVAQALAEGL